MSTNPGGLKQQIGLYSQDAVVNGQDPREFGRDFASERLRDQGAIDCLYTGIAEYQSAYQARVVAYVRNYRPIEHASDERAIEKGSYFREQFINFCTAKDISEQDACSLTLQEKQTSPEKGTKTLRGFFGAQGEALYQLALEEERYSKEYMDAVFHRSTNFYEGPKWAGRPVILVAGPSGSGKSTAATSAVIKASSLLPKYDEDKSGNYVTSVDGGIARQVSQMRKLAIRVAINKGYTGLSDLHNKSSILESVKDRVQDAAFAANDLGVVIPETFSGFFRLFDRSKKLLQRIMGLANTKPVFCRVDGEKPALFKPVVASMASKRAWETRDFTKKELDLNDFSVPESKAYGRRGFGFGQMGSRAAEKWFLNYCRKSNREHLSMTVINDLRLKKEEPVDSGHWISAREGEAGAILVSKRVFKKWQSLQINIEHLPEEERPTINLYNFINDLDSPPLLNTSAGMDLAIAKEAIRERIYVVERDIKQCTNPVKVERLSFKGLRLRNILGIMNLCNNSLTEVEINDFRRDLRTILQDMSNAGDFSWFFSSTKSALNNAIKALDKMKEEIGLSRLEEKPVLVDMMDIDFIMLPENSDSGDLPQDAPSISV